MKLLMIVLTMTGPSLAGAEPNHPLEARRELYTECRENGRFVPLSSTCCKETTDVQFLMTSSFRSASSIETCDQVDLDALMNNFGTYCTNRRYDHSSTLQCVYDVREHNADCAEKQLETCESNGGTLYASDILLECEEFNPLIRIKNSLSCLGVSCNDHDLQEYLWGAGVTANHGTLGKCKLINIHGQTQDEFQRENNRSRAGVVVAFVAAVLLFGVAIKVYQENFSRQRSTRLPQEEQVFLPSSNSKEEEEDVTIVDPLRDARKVTFSESREDDEPKALDAELA
ncbi:expressed unknown protein [Seminavis robusta]|uniref:Uncharacterized protein n=1 Tax=Seminavis robusta TaxID=568900 RepID=A0A9N8E7X2_9STRA|nr:expressed unknown protein [Seminavis robusta]|eukprot:Sro641_g180050.1 n/a (285) ;mRNA; r:32888-33742